LPSLSVSRFNSYTTLQAFYTMTGLVRHNMRFEPLAGKKLYLGFATEAPCCQVIANVIDTSTNTHIKSFDTTTKLTTLSAPTTSAVSLGLQEVYNTGLRSGYFSMEDAPELVQLVSYLMRYRQTAEREKWTVGVHIMTHSDDVDRVARSILSDKNASFLRDCVLNGYLPLPGMTKSVPRRIHGGLPGGIIAEIETEIETGVAKKKGLYALIKEGHLQGPTTYSLDEVTIRAHPPSMLEGSYWPVSVSNLHEVTPLPVLYSTTTGNMIMTHGKYSRVQPLLPCFGVDSYPNSTAVPPVGYFRHVSGNFEILKTPGTADINLDWFKISTPQGVQAILPCLIFYPTPDVAMRVLSDMEGRLTLLGTGIEVPGEVRNCRNVNVCRISWSSTIVNEAIALKTNRGDIITVPVKEINEAASLLFSSTLPQILCSTMSVHRRFQNTQPQSCFRSQMGMIKLGEELGRCYWTDERLIMTEIRMDRKFVNSSLMIEACYKDPFSGHSVSVLLKDFLMSTHRTDMLGIMPIADNMTEFTQPASGHLSISSRITHELNQVVDHISTSSLYVQLHQGRLALSAPLVCISQVMGPVQKEFKGKAKEVYLYLLMTYLRIFAAEKRNGQSSILITRDLQELSDNTFPYNTRGQRCVFATWGAKNTFSLDVRSDLVYTEGEPGAISEPRQGVPTQVWCPIAIRTCLIAFLLS